MPAAGKAAVTPAGEVGGDPLRPPLRGVGRFPPDDLRGISAMILFRSDAPLTEGGILTEPWPRIKGQDGSRRRVPTLDGGGHPDQGGKPTGGGDSGSGWAP